MQNQIAVILVGARNPLNIGAVARAMSNFGFADLRIVNDYAVPLEEARSAINAAHVLAEACTFATVAEAVADCTLVYGTTAVGDRKPNHPVDALPEVHTHTGNHRIALLFGSEKTGLPNDALSHCHRLLTIPMHQHGTSMNLGQAVAVCLYEFARTVLQPPPVSTDPAPATADQVALLDNVLLEALTESGYGERFPGNMAHDRLRILTRRLHLSSTDVPVWLGFLRQFLWKMRSR